MKQLFKIFFIFMGIILISGCNQEVKPEKNEFQILYNVETNLVTRISYEDFIEFTKNKTGVVFIGDDSESAKLLAKSFCDSLCECDINKAYFLKTSDIDDNQLINMFNVEDLNYPIIVAYKMGKLAGFYDEKTKTENINDYIDELIHKVYPATCDDAC
ncbi:MAG: hypothetical protein PHF21_00615 [Bacilli bacterium]|nr:hypothetical protein [Bacilli bacterium]